MRRTTLVLLATSLAAFTATLDNTVVAVALRDVQQDLGAGVTGLQGVVTAYTVALAALLLAGGAAVDVIGAKRVLLAGLLVFGVASAACASAGSVPVLVAARAVQGTGAALVLPGALAVLASGYPDLAERRRAVAVWAASGAFALVAGPVVGGELVASQGWTSVFWVNVPLCVVVGALVLLAPAAVATAGPEHRRRVDAPGALLASVTLGSAAYAVVLAGRHGFDADVLAVLAVGVVAAVGLAWVDTRTADPLIPGALLRDRPFRGATLGAFAAALAVFLLMVFISLFLQLAQDHDARGAGHVLLALPVAVVLGAALTTRWRATAVPVVLGLGTAGVGLLALGLVLRGSTSEGTLAGLLAVVGVGVGITTAPLVATALSRAGQSHAGLAAASVSVARELGGVVAVAGLGAVAVSRLSARLSATLTTIGVPHAKRPAVLDALLGARTDDARRMLLRDVGLERTLRAASSLQQTATTSFVASTRVALQVGAGLLLVAAVACGALLRHASRADRATS